MQTFLVIVVSVCVIALLFLAMRAFFRMLNNIGRKRREELIRQAMDSQTKDADRENVRQLILMHQQLEQGTSNTVQTDRKT